MNAKLRIAFVAGCLEPGRDGVGDYVRLLARECARMGHLCSLVALQDHFLPVNLQVEKEPLPVLRLSPALAWPERSREAQRFLDRWQPDWLSFHFVPYSFNPKGINYDLDRHLAPLTRGRRLHFMFHEVWIGEHQGAGLKQRMVGILQRHFTTRLVRRLKPAVIHTSAPGYVALLNQHRIPARRLPMFGAIQNEGVDGERWLFPVLRANGLDIGPQNRHQFVLCGFFGTLHPNWPAEPLFRYLSEVSESGRRVVVLSVGRLGSGSEAWDRLIRSYSSALTFVRLDEQPVPRISEFLNSLDFGISTTPYNIAGKSSTVAAMLEHGLPVVFNWDGEPLLLNSPPPDLPEPLLWKVERDLPLIVTEKCRGPAYSGVQVSAAQFIDALSGDW